MQISITQIYEDEWKTLKHVRLKALKNDPHAFGSNYKKEKAYTEQKWREILQNKNMGVFILHQGHLPIGMTGIVIDQNDPSEKTALLWGSWIEEDFRKKGESRITLKTAKKELIL